MASDITRYSGYYKEADLRYRGDFLKDFSADGTQNEKDKARYRCCGCLAAIKYVGSALGSIIYRKKTIEDGHVKGDYEKFGLSREEFDRQKALYNTYELEQDNIFSDNDRLGDKEFENWLNPGKEKDIKPTLRNRKNYDIESSSRELSTTERKEAVQKLYKTKKEGSEWPILYGLPSELRGVEGIENAGNSCTIASLLFNMFAASDFFDELLLVEHQLDDEIAKKIRNKLIEITNLLRSKKPFVTSDDLLELRYLVMPKNTDGKFLQPDEFLNQLFQKLNIDWENDNEFTHYSIMNDRKSENQSFVEIQKLIINDEKYRQHVRDYYPGQAEGMPIIKNEENKVLFINIPRQKATNFIEGYGSVEGYETSSSYNIIPSLNINVEGQKYKLQSVVANEKDSHNASWVFLSKDKDRKMLYYFNGGGIGTPRVEPKREVYDMLSKKSSRASDKGTENYLKLLRDGAFFIYVRE